eukprot:TRINITY_DN5540_c0_g1_i1.p2 TRINITY_DN5540_c0_g1~~TRINITY_DN5540_c0_g1_i1.p2  ORF type:complete len:473 (+),score=132.12 TRINITY_DN5540_c0_g1_i1:78-1421(+)
MLRAAALLSAAGLVAGKEVQCERTQEGGCFGHALLSEFTFPTGWTNLNHGSYGACPNPVRAARQRYQNEMDASPEAFFRVNMTGDGHTVYSDLVDRARVELAAYLAADPNSVVFVENASHGIAAVLRALAKFLSGKGILYLDTAYGMVRRMLQYLAGETSGVPPSPFLQTPIRMVPIRPLMPAITREQIVKAVAGELRKASGSIGLCVFSHITSTPGIILPVKELIEECHASGARVLIDGAHALGAIPLNLTELNADFYIGNGHKWLYSPKGSAFLHVREDAQSLVQPLVIDAGPGPTPFTQGFMWQGTEDPSAMIAVHDALAWRAQLGEAGVMRYMRSTAEEAARKVAAQWGTQMLPTDAAERAAMQGSLFNVRVPCGLSGEPPCPADLAQQGVKAAGSFVPMGEYAGPGKGTWARFSAAVYTEPDDFVRYAVAVQGLLQPAARLA